MSRRGAGEGAIYKDGSLWVATVEAGRDPVTGKRQRRKVKAKTKAEALRRAKIMRDQLEAGVSPDGTLTVATFLDRWLATVVTARVGAERTVTDYTGALAHVKRSLGTVPVIKLSPEQVDRFLQSKADTGLSRSYVGRMRMLLADALSHAEHRGLVARNVAALSVMPKCKPKPERQPFTAEQIKSLIEAAQAERRTGGGPRTERLAALILMGLILGLRPGELTGLLWDDLDLDAAVPTVSVSGSMKQKPKQTGKGYRLERGEVKRSTAGQRTMALPPKLVVALREHRRRQAEERLAIGALWEDYGLVFCSGNGNPLDPAHLRRTFARVAKNAGLEGNVFPYLMRHSVVSHLLDNGESIEKVADITGDDPVTLYRAYRHKTRPVATAALRMPDIIGL